MNDTWKEEIESFLKENSYIASNRLTKIKGLNEMMPVRYLNDNVSELYLKFIEKFEKNQIKPISKSTFRKQIKLKKIYKSPRRLTDLCDYCEWAKIARNEIKISLESLGFRYDEENFDEKSAIEYLDKQIKDLNSNFENEHVKHLKEVIS